MPPPPVGQSSEEEAPGAADQPLNPAASGEGADGADAPPLPAGQPPEETAETADRPPAPPEGDATGNDEEVAGNNSEVPVKKDSNSKNNDKRDASDDGDNQGDPKKAKTGDEDQDDQQQGQITDPAHRRSCAILQERLDEWRNETSAAHTVIYGCNMEDNDVHRAIAAVSEAVTGEGNHQFSLMDPTVWQRFAALGPEASNNTIARPGQEVLVPWISAGHISLFVLTRGLADSSSNGAGRFQMIHYESANEIGHRGTNFHSNRVCRMLLNAGWTRNGSDSDNIPDQSNAGISPRQHDGWVCGLHTVLTAWAIALDLRLSDRIEPSDDFIRDAIMLVRNAVRGRVDAHTIWAFLDCYRFIEPDQTVSISRGFGNTVAFLTPGDLAARVARIRIRGDIETLKAIGGIIAEFPPFETALETLRDPETLVEPDLTNMTAQEFAARFHEILNAVDPTPGTQQNGPQSQVPGSTQAALDRSLQEVDGEEERLLQQALDQSIRETGQGTGQDGATARQGANGDERGEQTGNRQSSQDIRDDEAAARAMQAQLDTRSDRQTPRTGTPIQRPDPTNPANGEQGSGAAGVNNGGTAGAGQSQQEAASSSSAPPMPLTSALAASWVTGEFAHLFQNQPDVQRHHVVPPTGGTNPPDDPAQQQQSGTSEEEDHRQRREERAPNAQRRSGTSEEEEERQRHEEQERDARRALSAVAAALASANAASNQPPPYDPILSTASAPYDPTAPQMPGTLSGHAGPPARERQVTPLWGGSDEEGDSDDFGSLFGDGPGEEDGSGSV